MSVQVSLNATCSGTLPELRRCFLENLAARGESERNIAAHGLGVERFAEFLTPRTPEDATRSDFESFLSYLSELGVSAESLKTYRTVVERWVAFLEARRAEENSEEVVTEVAAVQRRPFGEDFGASPSVAAVTARGSGAAESLAARSVEDLSPGAVPASAQAALAEPVAVAAPVGRPSPPPLASRPRSYSEPEPTTPMMASLAPPLAQQSPTAGFEPIVSERARPNDSEEDAFEPLDSEPLEQEALALEPVAAAFEPVAAAFEPVAAAFEPVAAAFEPVAAAFEPVAAAFEPVAAAFEPIEAVPSALFESEEVEPASCEVSPFAAPAILEAPSFEALPLASSSFGMPGPSSDGGVSAFGPIEDEVSVPLFGEASSKFEDFAPLAAENAEAEERDRAKLQAPPLPSTEAAGGASPFGDTAFEGPSASIPLVGQGASRSPSLAEVTERGRVPAGDRPATIDPTGGEMQTEPGTGQWGLRRPQGERDDLTLDAIITLAISGELGAKDLIRKPSGQWVVAADLRPLRRALGLDGGPSTAVRRVRDDLALGRAAAAMVIAGFGSGLIWWFTTLAVGVELLPLSILGGLLGGVCARVAARRPAFKVGLVGAGAAPMSVLVGRYLVFETLSSGVALDGFQEVGGFGSFLGSSLGITQLVCIGLGALAGFMMGSIGSR